MSDEITYGTVRELPPPPPRLSMTPEDCVAHGGHCFESTNFVLDSMPPQYPEVCKHCGKRRIGTPQPPMSYRYE